MARGTHRKDKLGGKHAGDPKPSRALELGRMDRLSLLALLGSLQAGHGPEVSQGATANMSKDQIIAAILRLEGK